MSCKFSFKYTNQTLIYSHSKYAFFCSSRGHYWAPGGGRAINPTHMYSPHHVQQTMLSHIYILEFYLFPIFHIFIMLVSVFDGYCETLIWWKKKKESKLNHFYFAALIFMICFTCIILNKYMQWVFRCDLSEIHLAVMSRCQGHCLESCLVTSVQQVSEAQEFLNSQVIVITGDGTPSDSVWGPPVDNRDLWWLNQLSSLCAYSGNLYHKQLSKMLKTYMAILHTDYLFLYLCFINSGIGWTWNN